MKPSLPGGFRDLTPRDIARREAVLGVIRKWFDRYNFLPIETPAVEYAALLEGKYGQEGEKLLFRILRNARELERALGRLSEAASLQEKVRLLSDQALRYDLTVPLARYVAMHKGDIRFPFKRYQIQPVWRGEKPQKGRYREFLQCDADTVGQPIGTADAEILMLAVRVFSELDVPFTLHVNDRRLLYHVAERLGVPPQQRLGFIITLDKLDKAGPQGVLKMLEADGMAAGPLQAVARLLQTLDATTDTAERLDYMAQHWAADAVLGDLRGILALIPEAFRAAVRFHPFLARGLDYYTATIFEVTAEGASIGSIAGGGRYDELGALFGVKDTPAVGISFGINRIIDVLEHLGRLSEAHPYQPRLLVTLTDAALSAPLFALVEQLRGRGVKAELFSRPVSLKKQLRHAQQSAVPYVLIVFPDEYAQGRVTLKRLADGAQQTLTVDALLRDAESLLA